MISLLESNDSADNLILRIIRTIPLKILTDNLARIYFLFLKYENNKYDVELFNRANDDSEGEE